MIDRPQKFPEFQPSYLRSNYVVLALLVWKLQDTGRVRLGWSVMVQVEGTPGAS